MCLHFDCVCICSYPSYFLNFLYCPKLATDADAILTAVNLLHSGPGIRHVTPSFHNMLEVCNLGLKRKFQPLQIGAGFSSAYEITVAIATAAAME